MLPQCLGSLRKAVSLGLRQLLLQRFDLDQGQVKLQLPLDGLYWDEGGLRDEPFPAGPNDEWKGWKACYEHHVVPMSTEIARLKIHHRNEYVEAYRQQEALGNGV